MGTAVYFTEQEIALIIFVAFTFSFWLLLSDKYED